MLETTAERLRREAVWRDPDKEMTVGQTIGTRLATLRHLWGAECAQQPNVEETAQKMHAVLREMATAVMRAGGRGSELHQLLDDAARAMEGSATTRAAANDTAFNKVKRVLAVDLPRPPQLAGGEESEEKSAKNELAKRLVPSLDRLTHMVAVAETAWRDATATTITRREQQEGAREFMLQERARGWVCSPSSTRGWCEEVLAERLRGARHEPQNMQRSLQSMDGMRQQRTQQR